MTDSNDHEEDSKFLALQWRVVPAEHDAGGHDEADALAIASAGWLAFRVLGFGARERPG
jgi:hypothetical protein